MNTLLRLSLALLILLGGVTTACGAAAIPVVAHEMKLLRSKGRVWKHSDGWLARMIARGETVEAEFELPQKLTAGQYYFFVKANNGGAALRMSCGGGGSAESCPVDNDGNGLWSDPIPITVADAAQSLSMAWTNKSRADAVNFILQGLYLTDRADVTVDADDCVLRRSDSAASDRTPPHPRQSPAQQQFRSGTRPGLAPGGEERTPRLRQRLAVGWGRGVSRPGQLESAGLGQLDLDGDPRPTGPPPHAFPSGPRPTRRKPRSSSNCPRFIEENKTVPPAARLTRTFPLTNQWQRLSLGGVLSGFSPRRVPDSDRRSGPAAADRRVATGGRRGLAVRRHAADRSRAACATQPAHLFFEDEPADHAAAGLQRHRPAARAARPLRGLRLPEPPDPRRRPVPSTSRPARRIADVSICRPAGGAASASCSGPTASPARTRKWSTR